MQRFLLVLICCCFLLSACGGGSAISQLGPSDQAINEPVEEQYAEAYLDEDDSAAEDESHEVAIIDRALSNFFEPEAFQAQIDDLAMYQLQIETSLGDGDTSVNVRYLEQSEDEVLRIERQEHRGLEQSTPNIIFYQDGVIYEQGSSCHEYSIDASTAQNNITAARTMIFMSLLEISMFDEYTLAERGVTLNGQIVDKYKVNESAFGSSNLWITAEGYIVKIEADLNIGQGPKTIQYELIPSEKPLNLSKPSAC